MSRKKRRILPQKINPELRYVRGELMLEGVSLIDLAKERKTPLYVYSSAAIESNFKSYASGFGDRDFSLCYSVKANSNLSILKQIASLSAGADIVSGGELFRALRAGIVPERIVFSGVGKTEDEIVSALCAGIMMFNVETRGELRAIDGVARRMGRVAPVSIRLNPNIDCGSHAHISTGSGSTKFGFSEEEASEVISSISSFPSVRFLGISCHIGSQIISLEPFSKMIDRMLDFIRAVAPGIIYVNCGGGLGIRYGEEDPTPVFRYTGLILDKFREHPFRLIIEPGRSIVGNAGVLLGKVHYVKDNACRRFYITDVGMNDILRPVLYGAYHEMIPCLETSDSEVVDLVGPICESGDVLFSDRSVFRVAPGGFFAILCAGAYGFSMSSNYNSRPRAAEILVCGDRYRVIRRRETLEDLIRGEEL